jgi:hypothetical protein
MLKTEIPKVIAIDLSSSMAELDSHEHRVQGPKADNILGFTRICVCDILALLRDVDGDPASRNRLLQLYESDGAVGIERFAQVASFSQTSSVGRARILLQEEMNWFSRMEGKHVLEILNRLRRRIPSTVREDGQSCLNEFMRDTLRNTSMQGPVVYAFSRRIQPKS